MDYVSECECGGWHLEIWKKTDHSTRKRIPFRCRSWRHEGSCRLWKGAQDFARIRTAIESRDFWLHAVLTFPRRTPTPTAKTFRSCLDHWAKLRKRLTREHGPLDYIQTWEVHKDGFPHLHLAVSNIELYSLCIKSPKQNWRSYLEPHAVASGFGYIGWLEPLRNKAAMAGYLVKLARELTGGGKDYQVPVNAPRHFRRIRASRGLLPPPLKDPELTGRLHRSPLPEAAVRGSLDPENA